MEFLSPTQPPGDGLRHQQANVAVQIEREKLGKGVLFIAEGHVSWINASGQGFVVPYPAISLHAVSRDLTAFPHENLYLMIDATVMPEILRIPSLRDAGGAGDEGDEEEGGEPEEDEAIRELRFIPDDKQALEKMFTVMSDCQTLHPDPDDSEPSDDGDEFDDAEEDEGVYEEAEAGEGLEADGVTGQGQQPPRPGSSPNGHVDTSMIKTTAQAADASVQDEAMDTGQFADADMEQDT